MTEAVRHLLEQALELNEDERTELIVALVKSLEPIQGEPATLSPAWANEISRRIAEIDAGTVMLESWDDVILKIEAEVLKK